MQEALQYHRLQRGIKNYRWWKPLIFGLLAIVFGFTLTQALVTIALIPAMISGDINAVFDFQERLIALDTQDPVALAVALLSLVVWIPAILLAGLAMGFKPVGRLWSVNYKIRWALLFRSFWPAILSLIAGNILSIAYLSFVHNEETFVQPETTVDVSRALISLVIILLLVPLQATAEELMFRGAMMQVLGAWLKSPVIPILLPSLLFAFGHLYDPWALLQIGILGIVAGWLTWRTGGLEAAIGLHVTNNMIAFLLMLTGTTGETGQTQETGTDFVLVLIQAASFVFYAYLILRITNKRGVTRPLGWRLLG